mmetsp:Transcript_129316/g.295040  ORF Transcript_129316/g.295040 Transcript_129316/m.295040 type:complete len:481 (-) Transcript_129316:83-1525(-)
MLRAAGVASQVARSFAPRRRMTTAVPGVTETVTKFLNYVNQTGSPYHSVSALLPGLQAKGFTALSEKDDWTTAVKPGGKYFVIRGSSMIFAFSIPEKVVVDTGMVFVAGHTDSPCLRIRPNNDQASEGYKQVGVECYGGGLWHTWLDRGLGFAGKVVVEGAGGALEEKLIRVDKPICLIPNLAIHLATADERAAFKISKEDNLQPVIATEAKVQLLGGDASVPGRKISGALAGILTKELGVEADKIVDLDLCLMDATPSRTWGVHDEFIESGRLDNLCSTWCAFEAIADSGASPSICCAIGFDHEEVGSQSWVGADSNAVETWVARITQALNMDKSRSLQNSILVSADMAHGVHPNYAGKHQRQHRPMMHEGVVIKENANQRYMSNAASMAITREVAKKQSPPVPIQDFVVKNDSPCGSTIGPMLCSNLGVRTVDVGVAQWAMHSVRESMGTDDLQHYLQLFKAFFTHFADVDSTYKGAL